MRHFKLMSGGNSQKKPVFEHRILLRGNKYSQRFSKYINRAFGKAQT